MVLEDLIDDAGAGIEAIGRHLDRLSPDQRWAEAGNLSRDRQRVLYLKAAASAPLQLSDLVPQEAFLEPVVHDGCNTLPVPNGIRHFRKHFCRPSGGEGSRLYGFNETPLRRLIGPGYFVAYETGSSPGWAERGNVVVDYFQVPSTPVPEHWPPVVSNDEGLQRFVYRGTRDFLRRVSAQVCVGAVYKGDRAMGHYFVLCRLDQA
ncbi:MAG TPA: hypothetical protein VHJ78_12705 [Actinomycetota bacterium]|nr:hypothetical protein [Actinomycetota bacterium]